ncbi:MAG: nitrile hydratase subunit beta, partial [Gemmatimonadales bacterium]
MNGVHDMGGMHGMGPIEPERNEPVFHEPWEGRVYALTRQIGPWGRGRNWGSFRFELESIPAADYLRMSYYERWFTTLLVNRLLRSNLVTQAELDSGEVDPNLPRPTLLPAPTDASAGSAQLDVAVSPRFRPEQRVRARNMHPRGHTRLPRYTRDKHGTVVRDHGVFALQDTDVNGQSLGERPQHVYTVRFAARELWGERVSERDAVYV